MSTITDTPTVEFYPPRVALSSNGLFSAITRGKAWTDIGTGPSRFSIGGVEVRTRNYGGEASTGVWNAPWCGDPDPSDSKKEGTRPEFPDKFEPIITWAYDSCDATSQSRAEVRDNAQQWLHIHAPIDVETEFAGRMLADGGSAVTSTSFLNALGKIEVAIASTGLPGFIHASPALAPYASNANELIKTGDALTTSLGSTWVFGGGYNSTLGVKMVATSQPYGWREAPALTEAMYEPNTAVGTAPNLFVVIAEQTFAIGYEKLIAVVTTTLP